ncbi:hypothetical protein FA95DRAFT_611107 [Auriscalpium vulgare]|uniref:Uncharacterized protein n=1 Tax=Auriscalpium vulgare TaxID=40419 RepID=A0ACB8REZ6_9AGAM|nr:hypothetical protein FA95DRAFT_611107 [Auriscalpium vulgare]
MVDETGGRTRLGRVSADDREVVVRDLVDMYSRSFLNMKRGRCKCTREFTETTSSTDPSHGVVSKEVDPVAVREARPRISGRKERTNVRCSNSTLISGHTKFHCSLEDVWEVWNELLDIRRPRDSDRNTRTNPSYLSRRPTTPLPHYTPHTINDVRRPDLPPLQTRPVSPPDAQLSARGHSSRSQHHPQSRLHSLGRLQRARTHDFRGRSGPRRDAGWRVARASPIPHGRWRAKTRRGAPQPSHPATGSPRAQRRGRHPTARGPGRHVCVEGGYPGGAHPRTAHGDGRRRKRALAAARRSLRAGGPGVRRGSASRASHGTARARDRARENRTAQCPDSVCKGGGGRRAGAGDVLRAGCADKLDGAEGPVEQQREESPGILCEGRGPSIHSGGPCSPVRSVSAGDVPGD